MARTWRRGVRPHSLGRRPRGPAPSPATEEELAFLPGESVGRPDPRPAGLSHRAVRDLPRAAPAVRSHPDVRRDVHGRPRPGGGTAGRGRNPCRQLAWSAARDSVRAQGPLRGARRPDHVGLLCVREPDHRRRLRGGPASARGRRSPGGQTLDWRVRERRPLVPRSDTESLEPGGGLQWLLGGSRLRDRGRLCRVRHRHGDAGLDRIARAAVRVERASSDVRKGQPLRRDGAGVEHGQDGTDLPKRRGLCARVRRDPRRGREGSGFAHHPVPVRAVAGSVRLPDRLHRGRARIVHDDARGAGGTPDTHGGASERRIQLPWRRIVGGVRLSRRARRGARADPRGSPGRRA